ncbi:MAG: sugar phosphate isomerase/epimerase family protein [Armatimonadota bacterium]|nr:sugar phosphate isomerase/epimerase family protein [Armatimonadota bacterium]
MMVPGQGNAHFPQDMEDRLGVRLGVSSFAAIRQPLQEVEAELTSYGVGVEVMCEPPHAWPAPVPWNGGGLLSLHMPILGINLASTNPGIREESVRQVLATVREAARLGARGVVVHPGLPPYEEVFPRDRGLPYAVESLRRIAEAAGAAGLEVYLENMPAVSVADGVPPIAFAYGVRYEELRDIYARVGHPALRLCLDLGHAYLAGARELEALLADRDVVHVHVSDNRGWRDDHLAWGDGEIAKRVDLARDLPDSVQTIIFEVKSLEACRTSLDRVASELVSRREQS